MVLFSYFQVTVQYKRKGNEYKPMFVHTVVISAMHQKGVSLDAQREELKEKVVKVIATLYYVYV